ncbi:MAG: hypothetical protein LC749_17780, partial [Actinobacteria bacterium]|nr:hypothetical protein [Actinomycetota bacterium]
ASTTGLDHECLESEVSADVGSAGLGLVLAAPDRPVQAVAYVVFAVVNEVEEPADFGEGERNKMPVDRWRSRLVRLVGLVGWIVVLV